MSEEKILEEHWLCVEKVYVPPVTEKISIGAYVKSIIITLLAITAFRLVGIIGVVIIFGIWYGIDQYIKYTKDTGNEL